MEINAWKKKSPIMMSITLLLFLALLILPLPVAAAATATTISINDVFLEPADNAVMAIMINNVSNLGVANINITYDPSVVHITTVNNSEFDTLYPVIDNSIGLVKIGVVDYGDGLSGDVKLADLMLKAVGNADETSTFAISINELKEGGATETPISATVDKGTAILNLPPVAIPGSLHRYNNIGSSYPCVTILTGSASYDLSSKGSITNYNWDFDDGQSSAGETVEHIYATWKWNGTSYRYEPFNVSLTVKDNGGLPNTANMPVNVYMAGDANGDGKVNILDAVILGREWREECTLTSYFWEERERADRADLNNDCKINILDAVIIGRNWRHTAW